jgi:DmsE family decaheme c-type cytochrome
MKRANVVGMLGAIWATSVLLAGAIPGEARAADPATAPGNMQKDGLAQDAKCTVCHNEAWRKPVLSIYQTPHGNRADSRAPLCTSCHGQSENHQKDPGGAHPEFVFAKDSKNVSPTQARNGQCLNCHESGKRMHWSGSQHESRDLACATCHTVHTPKDPVLVKATQPEVCFACHKTERAALHKISTHPILAGKMACSDCHNPHGSTGPTLLVKNSVNETCYTCHAEKRGPFLWEHSPVFDNCTNCHTPHGSTSTPLLKARVPWLCQECHSGDHGAAINSGANLPNGNATTTNGLTPFANQSPRAQTNARACLNCHVMIHGSNHPAGAKYQR